MCVCVCVFARVCLRVCVCVSVSDLFRISVCVVSYSAVDSADPNGIKAGFPVAEWLVWLFYYKSFRQAGRRAGDRQADRQTGRQAH